jgi:death-on-curing family protein
LESEVGGRTLARARDERGDVLVVTPVRFAMAAAYLFQLARDHPFVDGNKRTAPMCALVFLGLSGQRLRADPEELYSLVDGVAAGEVDKAEVSVFLRRHCVAR